MPLIEVESGVTYEDFKKNVYVSDGGNEIEGCVQDITFTTFPGESKIKTVAVI